MRKTIPIAALAALTLGVADAPATAAPSEATFTVHGCGTPERTTGPAAGWAAEPPVGKFSEASTSGCATAGTMTANNGAHKFAGYGFFVYDGVALVFDAPTGTQVSRLLLDATASASSRNTSGDYGAREMFPSVTGDGATMDLCKAVPEIGCLGGPSTFGYLVRNAVRNHPGLSARSLRIAVRCMIDSRCNALGSEPIGITVNRTEIDLTESPAAGPSVSDVRGGLAFDDVLRGSESLTFDATDNAAGVYRAIVTVAGAETVVPLADLPGSCADVRPNAGTAYEFDDPAPCPTAGTFSFDVDTTRLPEGAREITVHVEDAAGLRSKALGPRSVRIDNAASPDDPPATGTGTPPATGTGTPPATGTGTSPATGAGVGAAPTTSGTPGSAGAPNGVNASDRARIVLSGSRTRKLRFGQILRSTAVLRDEDGRPITGARVAVLQRMAAPGADWVPAREPLVTGADGRIRWTIPASYGRTIRLAYKANLANADFQSTSDLELRVRSKTSFKTNRRSFRTGQRIRFSGRLLSRPLPATGVLIDLQARVGSKWQTFETARSGSNGRWKASYRFRATRGLQRYAFRARVRKDSGFPYTSSTSRRLTVTVRG